MSKRLPNISQRMTAVQDPVIPLISDLINQTPDTISLGQGVVHYGPPDAVLKYIKDEGFSSDYHLYTQVEGISKLRTAIEKKLAQENNITLNKQSIIVTAGANMAFMNAMMAILDPGDEVILLKPYYFNHEMAINMLNAKVIGVDTDENFQPDLGKINAAITHKTRAIVTVSPNNPTGAVYSKADLIEINTLCERNNIYHISDEAYEYFTFETAEHFSPASSYGADKHTISIFSLSKAYGYASWRIGYMLVPEHLNMAIKKAQDTYLICPTRIAQEGAIIALNIGKSYCEQYLKQMTEVRNLLYDALQEINSFCHTPKTTGAFYFLLKLETNLTGMELAKNLIQQYKIAAIPGETFGMDKGCYLRVAYGALDKTHMDLGIMRLIAGLNGTIKKI